MMMMIMLKRRPIFVLGEFMTNFTAWVRGAQLLCLIGTADRTHLIMCMQTMDEFNTPATCMTLAWVPQKPSPLDGSKL